MRFKRERQYGAFKAKETDINQGILPQQISQLVKGERQYDVFKAKESINQGILPHVPNLWGTPQVTTHLHWTNPWFITCQTHNASQKPIA